MLRLLKLLLACAALAGCATPAIERSVTASGHSNRVRHMVLHYTALDDATSLKTLSRDEVSAHYLIAEKPAGRTYQLVDENRAAWHAGASRWFEQTAINLTSIGIELVNAGGQTQADGSLRYTPYSPAQMTALTRLLRELIQRHGIRPENIVGHSDIAPQRKLDPGPLFPWRELAQAGIGRWYDEAGAAAHLTRLQSQALPGVSWFQEQLSRLGYDSPRHGQLDRATRNVLAAFQMHYRPTRHDGQPDAETAAIMLAMRAQ
ncbi:N-acetylmuramoyl-L-alanine amidase [Bordetella avium]|uniref:N-acetylmuramoyl-L-alanine amidase n=1 Tax=Bordetella avium TaxID=521 RepID=UPI000E0AB1D9|nr:N-acetylmuramoyl-L-alanine amidase [Bordetella avium]RIQ13916.1 N-acetylmuramoyl-L-alanine amidase [Bordetella avium]RIQ51451.1 N-acetylmuramoyl-L-alanine amidase [Bordetella avium]RIQ56991.1 N-acetylmuramoyl-L-alanine amidase [Bordetella avium]RIQ66042.1 N-acetylmuramoyl-L-alanine amidase [Bordetella avium]RIQ66725.1 N-acetylmuramoyl-L-alanine amidase [Bordetella avium]